MRQPILIDGRRIYNTTEYRKTSIQSYRIRTTLNLITYIAHRYQHHIYTSENPNYLKRPLETRPNTYIGPYISIGDHVTIRNREIENTIVMEGAYIDCGRRITDSLIGRHINILGSDQNLPKEHTQINIPVPSSDATHLTQYEIRRFSTKQLRQLLIAQPTQKGDQQYSEDSTTS